MRFPDNSRVCFIGDSLTAQNQILPRVIDHYNKYFGNSNIRFFNCGTSGGTYKTAIEFFYVDVLSHNPTHAVVAFGVNDSNRWALESERSESRYLNLKSFYENFKKEVKIYCDMLKEHGVEIIICTPAPYDEYTITDQPSSKGGFALIAEYANVVRIFAKEKEIALCDYHAFITEQLQFDNEPIYSNDHVHPIEHGYYLMAKCFLDFQGLTIDKENNIPDYFNVWKENVQKLRLIYGTEQMVIHNYSKPLEEKMKMIEEKVKTENWGNPAFEPFIRGFYTEGRNKAELYKKIDEIYEKDIFNYYNK